MQCNTKLVTREGLTRIQFVHFLFHIDRRLLRRIRPTAVLFEECFKHRRIIRWDILSAHFGRFVV